MKKYNNIFIKKILLAAGSSRRYGHKNKLTEKFKGKYYTISERVFDIFCDGDSKLKEPHYRNVKATDAWLRWQGIAHTQSLPGDFIAGDTGVILKMKKEMKETEDYELSLEEKYVICKNRYTGANYDYQT